MRYGKHIAKLRDEFFRDNPEIADISTIGKTGQYLRNRLEKAFLAGCDARTPTKIKYDSLQGQCDRAQKLLDEQDIPDFAEDDKGITGNSIDARLKMFIEIQTEEIRIQVSEVEQWHRQKIVTKNVVTTNIAKKRGIPRGLLQVRYVLIFPQKMMIKDQAGEVEQ